MDTYSRPTTECGNMEDVKLNIYIGSRKISFVLTKEDIEQWNETSEAINKAIEREERRIIMEKMAQIIAKSEIKIRNDQHKAD